MLEGWDVPMLEGWDRPMLEGWNVPMFSGFTMIFESSVAPELFEDHITTMESDIYSFACICFEVISLYSLISWTDVRLS